MGDKNSELERMYEERYWGEKRVDLTIPQKPCSPSEIPDLRRNSEFVREEHIVPRNRNAESYMNVVQFFSFCPPQIYTLSRCDFDRYSQKEDTVASHRQLKTR